MARVIKDRDQHCQFPECTQSKNLQIHHIEHWADGGKTCVENEACLCQYHHTMVHEGGYRIEVVSKNEGLLREQFLVQRNVGDLGMFGVEAALRNDEVRMPDFLAIRITNIGLSLLLWATDPRARFGAIMLTTITTPTKHNLLAAKGTQKESGPKKHRRKMPMSAELA